MVDSQTYRSFSVKSSVKGEYTVHFINELQEKLIEINNDTNCVFIIDSKIKELFKDTFDIIFSKERFVIIDCSEANKTVNYALEVIELLLGQNVRINDTLIAVGGGITQDLVAFISTILYRGIEWKFFPTT